MPAKEVREHQQTEMFVAGVLLSGASFFLFSWKVGILVLLSIFFIYFSLNYFLGFIKRRIDRILNSIFNDNPSLKK